MKYARTITLVLALAATGAASAWQTSYRSIGNSIYGSDGSSCRTIGNSLHCSGN